MNIVKIGLALVTGLGFGFGVEKITETDITSNDQPDYEEYNDTSYQNCHDEENFLDHMLDRLSDEERIIVQAKIDDLLQEYNVTIEDLFRDYDIRYNFMTDLMEFLEDNDIEYYRQRGHHNHHYGYYN